MLVHHQRVSGKMWWTHTTGIVRNNGPDATRGWILKTQQRAKIQDVMPATLKGAPWHSRKHIG